MFEMLFKRPQAVTRHRDGPLAELRRRYLAHWAKQGMAPVTLRIMAEYLLTVIDYLGLKDQSTQLISLTKIEAAAQAWANRRPRPRRMVEKRRTCRRFHRVAKRWLQFIGRLQLPRPVPHSYVDRIVAFADFQREKGLSQATIDGRCRVAQRFLDRLCGGGRRLEEVTAAEIDDALTDQTRESSLKRVSVRDYAESLRAFFRYAERRGWCHKHLAAAIIAPRVYAQETIPAGPSWDDARRLLATTESDRPTDIRDRALLMLLLVYGFRSGEVRRLQLGDLDWERELIRLKRSKQGRTQIFPLSRTVGDAILRYLKEVRPRSPHREVFLTLLAPIQPLHDAALRQAVSQRLRALGVSLPHYGPHALRHACATHLLQRGHSLKEIGDYLGHVCPDTTRRYAKVNLAGLRIVADFDLEGLL